MNKTKGMNVSVTKHQEEMVRAHVQSGKYKSASEVVRDALRLLEVRNKRTAHLRSLIEEGIESGESEPLAMDEIIKEARASSAGA